MPRIRSTSEKINGWNIQKRDNAPEALKAKVQILRSVLDVIGADQARVFDAFAGSGVMHRAVWNQAASCVGCDEKDLFLDDPREAFVGDNTRIMRCIDLGAYNVFDYDAYGSPWEPIYLMMVRRTVAAGERIGVCLTEGQGMKMNMGGMSGALSTVGGVRQYMPGLGAGQQHIIDRAIMRMAQQMNTTIERHWQAISRHSSTIRYIGLVLRGND